MDFNYVLIFRLRGKSLGRRHTFLQVWKEEGGGTMKQTEKACGEEMQMKVGRTETFL